MLCDLPNSSEVICRVCDHPVRHSGAVFSPIGDSRETAKAALVRILDAASKSIPLSVVNGFDQPTVFPVYSFGSPVDELAESIEVKLRMLSLGRDRRTPELFRYIRGRQCAQR